MRSERSRAAGVIVVAVVAGAAAGPPVIAVADTAKGVIVENTRDAPVFSQAVGATAVTGTVRLADNTVRLPEGTKVRVDNGEYWSLQARVDVAAADLQAVAPDDEQYTVPAGKVLIVEGMSGQVTSGVGIVWLGRSSCPEPSPFGSVFGIITENRHSGNDFWSSDGTFNFRAGCVLKPSAAHVTGEGDDWAGFNLYGRLVAEE